MDVGVQRGSGRNENDKDEKRVSRDENRKEKQQQVGRSNSSVRKRLDLTELFAGLIADHQEAFLGKRERQDEPRREEEKEEERAALDLGVDNDHQRQEGKKNKQFECKQCGMQFVDDRALGGHVASHTRWSAKKKKVDDSPQGKFKCDECIRCFSSEWGLNVHKNAKHLPVVKFKCNECRKCFSKERGLKVHKIAKHCSVGEFKCDECIKYFSSERGLNVHKTAKRCSVGEFKCDECIKYFSSGRGLNQHKTTKHCPDISISSTSVSCRPPTPPSEKDDDGLPPSRSVL